MTKSKFTHAQEKIREALVQEYVSRHPGVREQDVVMACKNGKLVFMEISAVLADSELARKSGQVLLQATRLFSELVVHHDERWKDCIESTKHCKQMVDCLHSTHCASLSDGERFVLLQRIKELEERCAKATLRVHDTVKSLGELKKKGISLTTVRAKQLVVTYLAQIVEQLKVLLEVFQLEIELGDLFLQQTEKFIQKKIPSASTKSTTFHIQDIVTIYNALRKEKKISFQDLFLFQENILEETQKAILAALDAMRTTLQERRNQIQEIWNTIATFQTTISEIDESSTSDPSEAKSKDDSEKSSKRMARYLRNINPFFHF